MSPAAAETRAPPVVFAQAAPATSRSLAALLRRGWHDQRRAVIAWGGALGALSGFMAAIYPSIQRTVESVASHYPAGLKAAFGVETMNTVEGYVSAEMFSLIVPLAIAYLAIRSITSATVGAEETGRLDTILALPIRRSVLVAAAFLISAIVALLVLAIIGGLTFAAGRAAGTAISAARVAAGVVGVWPLAVFSAGAAALAAGLRPGSRVVTSTVLTLLIAMYALDLAGRLAHGLVALRWVSAFRYYGAPMRDGIDLAAFVGLAAAGVALALLGAWRFERRDLLH